MSSPKSQMPTARFDVPDELPGTAEVSARQEQFVCLLSNSHRGIYGLLVSLVGDKDTADDLMQEVSLLLWRKFETFDLQAEGSTQSFLKWASVIARNLVRNYYRQKAKGIVFDDELVSKIAITRIAAEEFLEMRRDALQQCLEKLTDREQKLLSICYDSDNDVKSAAKGFGKSADALYMSLSRLRQKLFYCVNRTLGIKR